MRPGLEIFGNGAVYLELADAAPEAGLFIPWHTIASGDNPPVTAPDAQVALVKILQKADDTLNESNRGTDPEDIVVTISYGEYDVISDPPGSGNTVRRDVFSVLCYQSQPFVPFNAEDLI